VLLKGALISLALLGSQPAIQVYDGVPNLKVEALCEATAADDKANGIVLGQSHESCMSDETTARRLRLLAPEFIGTFSRRLQPHSSFPIAGEILK